MVVGGGVTAADMAMLAGTKAAGWFAVSAIAGAENPEEAARTMVEGWKAVRGDKKHGYAPRVVAHTPAADTQAAQEGAAKPGSEATEKKFTNAKDAKDAQKLAKQQRVDIAARGSKQRDKAHIRKTKSVPFTYQYGSYDLEVPYTEIKLSDTPGVGPNPPFHDYNTEGPKCDPKEGLKPLRLDWIRDRGDIEDYEAAAATLRMMVSAPSSAAAPPRNGVDASMSRCAPRTTRSPRCGTPATASSPRRCSTWHPRELRCGARALRAGRRPRGDALQHQPPRGRADDYRIRLPDQAQRQHGQLGRHLLHRRGSGEADVGHQVGRRYRDGPVHR